MRRLALGMTGAALLSLALVATVVAADPSPTPARDQLRARDTVASVLGLTQAEVVELRRDGLTLAQIAARENVDPQKLIDALAARWTERIEARVAYGALTEEQATELKAQVETRAKAMVNQATMGGMRGAAVGAGPGSGGAGRGGPGDGAGNGPGAGPMGRGAGDGVCDGTGPRGRTAP